MPRENLSDQQLDPHLRDQLISRIRTDDQFRNQAVNGNYSEFNEDGYARNFIDGFIALHYQYLVDETTLAFFA